MNLSEFIREYHRLCERDESSRTPQTWGWRAIRFVGTYQDKTVEDPLRHNDPTWVKRLLALAHEGNLPAGVAACVPMPNPRGEFPFVPVPPHAIDWAGYAHASGDPRRRSRVGTSIPESERDRVQVKLSLDEDDARALRELAAERDTTVSALVAALVSAERGVR